MPRAPVICISHGGGPMPLLGDASQRDITESLKNRVPKILKIGTPEQPRAVVVVTAHWSTDEPTISSGAKHELYYDYYNFPKEAYSIKYDAPGSPELAGEVEKAFRDEGLSPVLDAKRGWDHGVFVPFKLIHPAADIPILQVSVLASEDPAAHLRLGAALSTLRDSNVAVLGSGFASFHNLGLMRQLRSGPAPDTAAGRLLQRTEEWSAALAAVVTSGSPAERAEGLLKWRELPHSYEMHPPGGGEHFMPLIVCAGAAGDDVVGAYKDTFLGVGIWTYYWGSDVLAESPT